MSQKSKSKQLFLDIGNTSVTYGLYRGRKVLRSGSAISSNIPKMIKNWSENGKKSKFDVVIGSVVPKTTRSIRAKIGKIKGVKVHEVGKSLPIKVKNRYRSRKNLGIDRLVNIYGAKRFYKAPLLILDYGTAITADYVSKKGVFEGGMIVPGPEISFQALLERAAKIPNKLQLPTKSKKFLGTNTYDCICSGILEGYGAITDGLIDRFKKRYGKNLKVIATGGFVQNLKKYIRTKYTYVPLLSIRSLHALFWEREKELSRDRK